MKTHLLSLVGLFLCPFLFSQISVNGSQIKDLADPTEAQDAVTKAYIQSLEEKLDKLQNSLAKKGYYSDDIIWQRAEETEQPISNGNWLYDLRWWYSFSDSNDNTVIYGRKRILDEEGKTTPCVKKLDTNGEILWEREYDFPITSSFRTSIENNSKNGYVITLFQEDEFENTLSGLFEINHEGELANYFEPEPVPDMIYFRDIVSFTNGYVTLSNTFSENNNYGFRIQEFSNKIEPTNSFFVDMDENFTAEKIIPFQSDYVICGNTGDNGVVFRINPLTQQIVWTKNLVAKQTRTIRNIEEDIFITGVDNRESWESGFVMKIDQNGDLQDEAYLDHSPIINMTTHNNDLYLIGSLNDPNYSSIYGLTGFGSSDVLIHKLNYNLDVIWSKNYGGSRPDSQSRSSHLFANIHIKNNNNIIIGTDTSSNDFLVERIKYDTAHWIFEIQNN